MASTFVEATLLKPNSIAKYSCQLPVLTVRKGVPHVSPPRRLASPEGCGVGVRGEGRGLASGWPLGLAERERAGRSQLPVPGRDERTDALDRIASSIPSYPCCIPERIDLATMVHLETGSVDILLYRQWYIVVLLSTDKCPYCKSLWTKASAKCPKCKCITSLVITFLFCNWLSP